MRIRLYPEPGPPEPARPVATLVIGPRREGASLPGRIDPAARFFLEAVESDDPGQRERLIALLTHDSVPVHRASSSATRGPIRTRGDYTDEEPYGTATYWRTVVGRLPATAELRFDLDDYNRAVQVMEAHVPVTGPISRAASVGAVIQDEPEPATPPARGRAFDIQAALQELQLLLGGRLAVGCGAGPTAVAPPAAEPAQLLADLLQQMCDDPAFFQAVAHLRAARTHPRFRSVILPALENFAREAKDQEGR